MPAPSSWVRAVVTAAALASVVGTSGCSRDPQEVYCETVEEQQETLTEIAAGEDPGSLLGALPAYRELAEDAPRDIAADWDQVVGALEGLSEAVEDAGVDPEEYDAADPPADVTEEDRKAIARAAEELGGQATVSAMTRVEQHALDVCGTPLSR